MDRRLFALLFVLIVASGFALRLFLIEVRPLHHDEGVNGYFAAQVLNGNSWRYNPENYHGPLPFYLIALAFAIFGETVFSLRIVPVLFGSLMPVLLLPFRKSLGDKGTLFAAFLLSFSPSLFYYSMDAIHEIFFAFFILASIVFLFSFLENGNKVFLYAGIASLSFLFTVKEGAFLVAPAILLLFLFFLNSKKKNKLSDILGNAKTIIICIVIFITIFALLFSSFFANIQGIADAFKAPLLWSEKMTGHSGHEKHELYYLEIIAFSDLPILLLGLLGAFIALQRKNGTMLAIFAFFILLFIGASIPKYKVPWGTINFIPPLALLAGYFIESIARKVKNLELFYSLLAIVMVFVFWQAVFLSAFKSASQENKLAYVQTTNEAKQIVERIETLQNEKNVKIAIINKQSVWPLPWWLKRFNVSYYNAETISEFDVSGYDVVLIEAAYSHKVKNASNFEKKHFALRPGLAMDAFFGKE
ncbi:MAG: TIGR03663 family protein [Candidatus Diapherotrites archaeon]|nr:TIGR03663 family protein [Candidatus Diapherotrites archaeon]